MRITFLPRNVDGSGMYRCFFPAMQVTAAGHTMVSPGVSMFNAQGQPLEPVNNQLPDGWINMAFGPWPDADIFVFQMPMDPNWIRSIEELKAAGRKVVVELDDDFTCVPSYNPYGHQPEATKVLHRCVQLADAVSVSTPSLKRSYKSLNKNVTVLPNRLHWPMWEGITPVYEQSWERTRIGYMGRMDFHSADLDVIRPWFRKWIVSHPEVEFVATGDPRVCDHLEVPVEQRVCTDSVDFRHLELGYVTATFDIGLVPLVKNRFNEGKSYLKGLEYSACGIVPIATPTEQYRSLITSGVDGFLVEHRNSWIGALETLVGDRALTERMGRCAREKASKFTYETHVQEWLDFFERVFPEGKKRLLWDDGDNAVAAGQREAAGGVQG